MSNNVSTCRHQSYRYDLYIIHSDEDSVWVNGVLLDFFKDVPQNRIVTHNDLSPGSVRIQAAADAIESSRCALIVLSESYQSGKWSHFIGNLAQHLRLEHQKRLVPIRLDDVEVEVGLEALVHLDCRTTAECTLALNRLRTTLGFDDAPETEEIECPYPGLLHYSTRHSVGWAGYEEERSALIDRLGTSTYTVLIGRSGSGKSSLLNAGVVPILRRKGVPVTIVRPGPEPEERINARIERAPGTADGGVLIIDQFEEIFTNSEANVDQLLGGILMRGNMRTIISLRSDFYEDLMDSTLGRRVGHNIIYLKPLRGDRLRRAIEAPAASAGVFLSQRLLDKLVQEISEEPGSLAALQETMRRLWQHRERKLITLQSYERLSRGGGRSGLEMALLDLADESITRISESDIPTTKRIFLRLIAFGEGRAHTRRQQGLSSLILSEGERVRDILDHLQRGRLIVVDRENNIDISHEVIIQKWTLLRSWIKQHQDSEVLRRRLNRRAQDWQARGKVGGLLDELELGGAERWCSSSDGVVVGVGDLLERFIKASRRKLDYQIRIKRYSVLAALCVLAVGFAVNFHQRGRVENTLRDLRRLSDMRLLEQYMESAAKMWPARPKTKGQLRMWLQEVTPLEVRLPAHRSALRELKHDHAQQNNNQIEWQIELLEELIGVLEQFFYHRRGAVASVRRRLQVAEDVVENTVVKYRMEWRRAIDRVAADGKYHGLKIDPQVGLIPLGANPLTGFQEFLNYETHEGAMPQHFENGDIVVSNTTGLIFILLPGGSFWMGAQSRNETARNYDRHAGGQEGPVKRVELDPFFISKYEMTQGQWLRATGRNPSQYAPPFTAVGNTYSLAHPVEQVSWNECSRVCFQLDLMLPTEAQWEYAARGGASTAWWTGRDRETLRGSANLADQAAARAGASWPDIQEWPDLDDGYAFHAPVHTFSANPFGLHNVHGNVWEWCRDWHGSKRDLVRRGDGERLNGDGRTKVARGGSFSRPASGARVTSSYFQVPQTQVNFVGVRPGRRLER